jgi:hypothetical protein
MISALPGSFRFTQLQFLSCMKRTAATAAAAAAVPVVKPFVVETPFKGTVWSAWLNKIPPNS